MSPKNGLIIGVVFVTIIAILACAAFGPTPVPPTPTLGPEWIRVYERQPIEVGDVTLTLLGVTSLDTCSNCYGYSFKIQDGDFEHIEQRALDFNTGQQPIWLTIGYDSKTEKREYLKLIYIVGSLSEEDAIYVRYEKEP